MKKKKKKVEEIAGDNWYSWTLKIMSSRTDREWEEETVYTLSNLSIYFRIWR